MSTTPTARQSPVAAQSAGAKAPQPPPCVTAPATTQPAQPVDSGATMPSSGTPGLPGASTPSAAAGIALPSDSDKAASAMTAAAPAIPATAAPPSATPGSSDPSAATLTAGASVTAKTGAPGTEGTAPAEAQAAPPKQDGAGDSSRDGGEPGGGPAQLPVPSRPKRRFNSRADVAGAMETLVQWTVMGKMEAGDARTLAGVLKNLADLLPTESASGGAELVSLALRERLQADPALLNELATLLTPAQLDAMLREHDAPRK